MTHLRHVKRLAIGILAAAGLVVVLVVATYTLPPLLIRDEPVAAGLQPLVEDARRSIIGQSRVFPRPLHPRLIDARCFSDETIALYFEEWVPPYLGVRYAVAVGPLDPVDGMSGWGGGYHLDEIGPGSSIESELAGQLGDEVACP